MTPQGAGQLTFLGNDSAVLLVATGPQAYVMWDPRILHDGTVGEVLAGAAILSTEALHHLGLSIITKHRDVAGVRLGGALHRGVLPVLHGHMWQSDGIRGDRPSDAVHVAEASPSNSLTQLPPSRCVT